MSKAHIYGKGFCPLQTPKASKRQAFGDIDLAKLR